MASLSADLLHDILKRLDGTALARAGCACADFHAASREEELWENACRSMWPSTRPTKATFSVKNGESDYHYYDDDDMDELEPDDALPSDFVSLIDERYRDRALYSEVVWGIPNSDGANGWFYDCPFRMDLLDHSSEDNGNNDDDGELLLPAINDLPWLPSMEQERKDGKLWKELHDGVKLSWIVNRRMERAVNLAAKEALPPPLPWCRVAECVLLVKLRVRSMGRRETGEPQPPALALSEVSMRSMRIEDMSGGRLDGRRRWHPGVRCPVYHVVQKAGQLLKVGSVADLQCNVCGLVPSMLHRKEFRSSDPLDVWEFQKYFGGLHE
ncbi:F-box protein At3g44326-like [Oryza brachyantha]|uniref:F-box protein At3g44326-like n=1 Tax=Oryza brachyantha TaxID=4533 RepID=UPI001ADCA557|nr:F-box protein At3g44326-like [Oryza brachyantha]